MFEMSCSTCGNKKFHCFRHCLNFSNYKPDYDTLNKFYNAMACKAEEMDLALQYAVEDLRRETGEKDAGALMEKYKIRAAKAFEGARMS